MKHLVDQMSDTEQQALGMEIFTAALFIAEKNRFNNREAIDFYEASETEKFAYLNDVILPAWEAVDCPLPLTEGWLLFTDRLFGRPEKTGR